MELPSHNPMVYQGVVYWAAMNKFLGYNFSVALSTGRIPLNNPLAASYLEISEDMDLIRLVPEAWHQVPQILIPAMNKNAIDSIRGKIGINNHALSSRVSNVFQEVMSCMELNNESFTDQIASAQSLMMSKSMPVRHVSIESESIAVKFLIRLFSDNNSLAHRVFSDKSLRANFLDSFGAIGTGWKKNSSPFYETVYSEKFPKLAEYSGGLEPEEILQKLQQGNIIPKGVMKFFVFMIEGGLLPVGGIAQNVYCSEIKRRAMLFLDLLGEKGRANELINMPTEIATITPCWSMNNSNTGRMTNILNCLEVPLNSDDLLQMLNISGAESIMNASPVLYPFLTGKPFCLVNLNG